MIHTRFLRDASGRRTEAPEQVVSVADLLQLVARLEQEARVLANYGSSRAVAVDKLASTIRQHTTAHAFSGVRATSKGK